MMMMMLLLLLLLLLLLMIVLMLLLHPMSSRSSLRAGNDAGCLRSLWGRSGWLLRTSATTVVLESLAHFFHTA